MAPTKEENGDESKQNAPEYRDRLRTWLIKMIDSGTIQGLQWENDEKTIFRMPWKHAGRQDYSLEEDSRIFMAWAIHSGRYREGIDKPEPIIWKTRLRCALNKMPDIREIPERSRLDISEPYRVYHLLPPVHKDTQIRRRLQRRHSAVQSTETRHAPLLNSPTFTRNEASHEANLSSPPSSLKFTESGLPTRPIDLPLGANRHDLPHPPQLDLGGFRRPGHWLGASSLVSGASENRLLQGLNLNCLSPTASFHNLMNPANLFSPALLSRDIRNRPDFDFTSLPYHPSLLDQPALHPFLLHGTSSMGGLPLPTKPVLPTTAFNPSFKVSSMATEENRDRILGMVRIKDEKDEAKHRIELLELEITRWKNAYEKEKLLREETERKHEYLKKALENVGGDILAMSRIEQSNYESDDNDAKNSNKTAKFQSKSHPNSTRRRSSDDKFGLESNNMLPSSKQNSKNGRDSPRNKRQHSKDGILDLSSTSPKKMMRADFGEEKKIVKANREKIATEVRNGIFLPENFRPSSRSPRLSSDCDENNMMTSNVGKPIKSPSVLSSCSSAEESYAGSTLSPTIPRASPVLPIYRPADSPKYTAYSQRVEGAIQVT